MTKSFYDYSCSCLLGHVCIHSLGLYLGELLGHRVCLWSAQLIPLVLQSARANFTYLEAMYDHPSCSTSSPTLLAHQGFNLHRPLIKKIEHFFMCWLTFRIFSLEKWLFPFFTHFFYWVFLFLGVLENILEMYPFVGYR